MRNRFRILVFLLGGFLLGGSVLLGCGRSPKDPISSIVVSDAAPEGMVEDIPEDPPISDAAPEGMVEDIPEDPPVSDAAPEGMVLIPAGEFLMGSNDPQAAENDEQPVHKVYVDAFYMDVHEVTNLEYQRFVLANPEWQKDHILRSLNPSGRYLRYWDGTNYPIGKANHPVQFVNWYAAMAYAEWAGKRLPTEAEWEKAARGGKEGLRYPWGNTISPANYNTKGSARAVGSYAANGYGLYDMAGNVWEWCLDRYDGDFYSTSPDRNPLSDVDTIANLALIVDNYKNVKTSRVLRGGDYRSSSPLEVRAANRLGVAPSRTDFLFGLGFRCVRAVTP